MGAHGVWRGLLASIISSVALLAVASTSEAAGDEAGLSDERSLSVVVAPLPDGAASQPAADLHDVACPRPATCFAVGSFQRPGFDQRPLIEQWRDGQWAPVEPALPSDATVSPVTTLTSVSCASPTYCVAIGIYVGAEPSLANRPLVETWDGSAWTPRSARLPRDASPKRLSTLTAVSCGGVSACELVGSYVVPGLRRPLALTLADGHWHSRPGRLPGGGTGGELLDVDCVSATACTAVGDFDVHFRGQHPFAVVRDRASWTVAALPEPPGVGPTGTALPRAVSCRTARRCTVVGEDTVVRDGRGRTTALVDVLGQRGWRLDRLRDSGPSRAPDASLMHLSCPSSGPCLAVGGYRNDQGGVGGVVARIGGRRGSYASVMVPDQASANLLLADSACAGPRRCVAVGTYADGVTLRPVAVGLGGQPTFLAFPGPLSPSTLEAVTTDSPATAVAVGSLYGTGQAVLVTGIAVSKNQS